MSHSKHSKAVNIEGKIYISSDSSIHPEPGGKARGLFIYDHQNGDFTDIERDLEDAAFVVSKADDSSSIDQINKEIQSYKKAHLGTELRLGIALSYSGAKTLQSLSNDLTPSNSVEHYADAFNRHDGWDFRPILHISKAIIENETTAGLEYNVNEQLNYLKKETKYQPIIHTSFEIAEEYLIDHVFAKFPLWLTNAKAHDSHNLPGAWKNGHWHFLELDEYLETGLIVEKGHTVTESIIYGTNKFNGNKKELDHFTEGRTTTKWTGKRTFKL